MPLADREARERATTADDCNLVVTAGAGTGKTTLLVNRLIYLLLRDTDPLPLPTIVALTFTNKAASELKVRLRERLRNMLHDSAERESGFTGDSLVPAQQRRERIVRALQAMEVSCIGTIHHFAARLLRLYPAECGVDPTFIEDEGHVFKAIFDREWTVWMDHELGPDGQQHDRWRSVFHHVSLSEVKTLVCSLSSDLVPLRDYAQSMHHCAMPAILRDWLVHQAMEARRLCAAHAQRRTLERLLEIAEQVFDYVIRTGDGGWHNPECQKWATLLTRSIPSRTQGWTEDEYESATRLIRVAQYVASLQPSVLDQIVALALPFIEQCRRRLTREGYVSFDGVIVRARNLLRDDLRIRRELKHQIRAVLVDEFQDTDPLQYEIILYLAEEKDGEARTWEQVKLEPGKLFIVGDPKQSIYAFRRADMEAYDRVVRQNILGAGETGEQQTLRVNFRSHQKLLNVINAMFARLFPADGVEGVQPPFEPLASVDHGAPPLDGEGVELRLVRPLEGQDERAEAVTRLEADALACWLKEEVINRASIRESQETVVHVKPRHIAILFRKLSSVQPYLEALRRYRIPFLVEGERHFYERQEIIDLVTLLRAAVRPHDRIALVGVLRSPLGAMNDREIEVLARNGLLDYRCPPSVCENNPDDEECSRAFARVAPVYHLLRELHACLPHVPAGEMFDVLFDKVPLLEIAAASMDGERAVANLKKFQRLAHEFMEANQQSLTGLVEEMSRRLADPPPEGEAEYGDIEQDEDGEGAIQILSMHRAKGLEFPLVILAGLHQHVGGRDQVLVHHDWCTNVFGLRFKQWQTLGGIYVGQKLEERERAERLRLLYVAMTRACRRLTLFSAVPRTLRSDSFLSLILRGLNADLAALTTNCSLEVGGERVPVSVLTIDEERLRPATREEPEHRALQTPLDVDRVVETWNNRTVRWKAIRTRTPSESPSRFATSRAEIAQHRSRNEVSSASTSHAGRGDQPLERERARLLGVIAHRVLATWDFRAAPDESLARIERATSQHLPRQWQARLPEFVEELVRIFRAFRDSEAYALLQHATILGREIPFSMPWSDVGQMGRHTLQWQLAPSLEADGESWRMGQESSIAWSGMQGTQTRTQPLIVEGVIDVLYQVDGNCWVGEYKTDLVDEREEFERVARYRPQLALYRRAIERGLGLDHVGTRLFFLRTGRSYVVDDINERS